MADARTISALAARIVDLVEAEIVDHDPMVGRSALLAAGETFLQKAALENVINSLHRAQRR